MVAIIGREDARLPPLINSISEAGKRAASLPERLTVGMHALGYVAETARLAADVPSPAMPGPLPQWQGSGVGRSRAPSSILS